VDLPAVSRCLIWTGLSNILWRPKWYIGQEKTDKGAGGRQSKITHPRCKSTFRPPSVYMLFGTPFSSTISGPTPADHENVVAVFNCSPCNTSQLQSFFESVQSQGRQDNFAAVSRALSPPRTQPSFLSTRERRSRTGTNSSSGLESSALGAPIYLEGRSSLADDDARVLRKAGNAAIFPQLIQSRCFSKSMSSSSRRTWIAFDKSQQ
jgi:hypothetical protein